MLDSIGKRIRYLRTEAKISMDKLAESINSRSSTITYWENDQRLPSAEYIIALANFFNVSTDWLLTGKESGSKWSKNKAAIEGFLEGIEEAQKEQTPGDDIGKSALFFGDEWETTSHFDKLIESLDEQDRAFISRYIELALFQKKHKGKEAKEEQAAALAEPKQKQPKVKEEPVEYTAPTSAIPILGRAAAGVPVELVRFIEGYLRVPDKFKNCFAVRVHGESMVNAGIEDGGYVIVRQQPVVNDGEIALVKVEDGVTIKRFKMKNGKAYLISENDNVEDMIYDPREKDMQILGHVVETITREQAANLFIEEL
ncbi:helix-turn-helix domain-containing protein [Paenibacillus dendritiformis]|uniref:helix-turn-helix domain-containing protein n=1 Tax=Paenibacillus dendritiformis TaxID=130049 RepID=UPI000DA7BB3D|nr:XRE family transcriptional regulator [Paenibacillus dendritiformis]PZM65685.1 XRE family transcriptional regulator [Paenibacillus dendritiformis]